MIFGSHQGLPPWKNGAFEVPAPRMPPSCRQESHYQASYLSKRCEVECAMSVATANVQSLHKGPEGHGGKLHYLQAQMQYYQINCLAIQEARTEAGLRVANNILCFASGHRAGQLGMEIWINLDQPIGWQKTRGSYKEHKLTRSAFCVVHGDPQRLLLRCDHQLLDCWFFTAHAPHSGRPLSERAQWWQETQELLKNHCDTAPMIWMLDANAAPGPKDGKAVLSHGFTTSSSTQFLREALHERELCLPATSACHRGDHETWTAPSGDSRHCIDHIAVPFAWLERCTLSQVLEDFDLAQRHDDHQVVVLQMQWSTNIMKQLPKNKRSSFMHVDFKDPILKSRLQGFQPAAWQDDIETHTDHLVHHLHDAMSQTSKTAAATAKKLYVTPEVWQRRIQKLQCRSKNQQLRRRIASEALYLCFTAWKTQQMPAGREENFNYGTTLRCLQVKSFFGFCTHRKLMRQLLQRSKAELLRQRLESVSEKASAADILKELRPFIGPTNPRKQKRAVLPLVHTADGRPCQLPTEALATWIDFFKDMEAGKRVNQEQLRCQWREHLQGFSQREVQVPLKEVPTLTDLELACRRVACKKATGPDGVPGELCRYHPELLAPATYAQMLKTAIHGHEPLLFKGGLLVPAYKGKGPTWQVNSYRSLLISSHVGKIIHRCIRQHKADTYEKYLQAQQLGGRRRVPVQMALHQARAFIRQAKAKGCSAGLLFLDLTEAFYRILRELSMGGVPTDELLSHVFHKLKLPDDSLQQLQEILDAGTAFDHAGLSATSKNCLKAIHSDTHFWLAEQNDFVATALGTRPGDSFADVIFGFTWSMVLKKLQTYLEVHEIIAKIPVTEEPPFFAEPHDVTTTKSFVGPTWMDDLCLCVQHGTAAGLERAIGPATSYLLDLCEQHLMTPNLGKGKTELMLCFHGAGSRKLKVRHYGPQANGSFTVVCERRTVEITLVKEYRHLGGVLHHTGDQFREVAQRLAIGHGAFNQHRRLLYHNVGIDVQKRQEIFNTLVLTKILYGADSWIAGDLRTMKKFEAAVMKLYRRLQKLKPEDHMPADAILSNMTLPTPATLLRRTRLRYLAVLFRCEVPDVWHLFCEDRQWVHVIEDDMMWMWQQLRHASSLGEPSHHAHQWFDLIKHHPSYWKRLINRACLHEALQLKKNWEVVSSHVRILDRLHAFCDDHLGESSWDVQKEHDSEEMQFFGCVSCGLRCRNRAGEAAHMFKKHKQQSLCRALAAGTQCGACLKEFHTYSRIKAHLHYKSECRRVLLSRGNQHPSQPGSGSTADQALAKRHDRMLPPLQAEGPQPEAHLHREHQDIDDKLYIFLVDYFVEQREQELEEQELHAALQTHLQQHAISWSSMTRTFNFFVDNLNDTDADFLGVPLRRIYKVFESLGRPEAWAFGSFTKPSKLDRSTIPSIHEALGNLADQLEQKHLCAEVLRSFAKHRIILHAFAGRRRLGDIQYYLERDMHPDSGFTMTVVSLDIVIDATWGDASRSTTRELWLRAIRERHVLAFIAGPPCETWSRARGVQAEPQADDDEGHMPRVLRDEAELWGFSCLAIREAYQVIMGNCLLCFALEALVETAIAGSVGLLEHPAEPTDCKGLASIWKLPIMQVLVLLPGVERLRFAQGLMGSKTPKPTELLSVNLPHMLPFLHKYRVRKELPHGRAVGKDALGGWRTTALKEYAPAFCRAIASAIRSVFDHRAVTDESPVIPQHFLDLCQSMQVSHFGDFIGKDYAVR